MEAVKQLLGFSKPVAPERVPTDTVITLYNYDDTYANRNVAFDFTMQFDEVLDADKLAEALWRLVEKPGWRKLGARLRLNNAGKLEYHVPAQFTKERPPINFTKASYEMSREEHPVMKNLPRPTGRLEAFNVEKPLREALQLENHTCLLADWIYADVAQLGLHVCTFTDATFVTVTWLHTLLDAMSRNILFKAWVAMLEGREEDVPEFFGYDSNPLQKLGAPPDKVEAAESQTPKIEESVLRPKLMRGLSLGRFIFNMIWENVFYPREHFRMICMPASYLTSLRARAFKDLETLDPSLLTLNSSTGKPFLSDGDILCAWLTQLITRSNSTLSTASAASRTQLVINIFGVRDLISQPSDGFAAIIPKGQAYIGNCISGISSLIPMRDFLTLPLGHIAAQVRRDLTTQTTRAQIEATIRLGHKPDGSFQTPLFGPGDANLSVFSNWTKAKLFETDFSAAVVGEARTLKKQGRRGKPVYLHLDPISGRISLRGSGNCFGTDGEGNVWFGPTVREEFTRNLDALIREMDREEYGDAA